MKILRLAVVLLLLAAPVWAAETKPIGELDALLLEKAQLEIQLLQERITLLKERAVRFAQDIQRRDGTVGWDIDLEKRVWVKPEPPKGQ